mgnify:FL=1
MFVEKEPAKAVEAKKLKQALEKEPAPETRSKDLKGLGFDEQKKALSARARTEPLAPGKREPVKGDPAQELRRLFRSHDLPDRLVPANVTDFRFDRGSGLLTITLRAGFARRFDRENTLAFDKVVSGVLQKGAFAGISGITCGSSAVTGISRTGPGLILLEGRLGPSGKPVQLKDESLPGLP